MLVFRPIKEKDSQALFKIAESVGSGFTSLPKNHDILDKKIQRSIDSFYKKNNASENSHYLLVLEDIANNKIAGIGGIEAGAGNQGPFYNFKVSTITQVCDSLGLYLAHDVLQLVNDFQNASELVSLFLHDQYKGQKYGQLLSRSRLLFMGQFPEWFSKVIIAEIRGVSTETGESPFWSSLGKYFFDMDFLEADYLTTVKGKQFISDLMPRYPIYVELLQEAAKKVIGKPHVKAEPALHLLKKEGFKYRNYIDIFDGGPLIECERDDIKTIANSRQAKIKKCVKNISDRTPFMICNTRVDFRLTLGSLIEHKEENTIEMTVDVAKALEVAEGDTVRYCKF